jgi:hypothetical protein
LCQFQASSQFEADQEQVFEEEEPQCLSKEGKWSSPLYDSILSYVIA